MFSQVMSETWNCNSLSMDMESDRQYTYLTGVTNLGIIPINTLRHTDRLPDVLDPEVPEGDILDPSTATAAGITVVRHGPVLSLPCLDPCTVGRVDEVDILKDDVLHIVWEPWHLAHRANRHTVRVVAGDVLCDDVGAVAFNSNAVVAWYDR